jgi:hypothetical protein
MLARYGQAKPCKRPAVILPEYNKIFITRAARGGEYTLVILASGQAVTAGKSPAAGGNVCARNDGGSHGQAFTTLGTAAAEYLAPVTGAHTGTEAVSAFALDLTGLKSSFHGRYRARLSVITKDAIWRRKRRQGYCFDPVVSTAMTSNRPVNSGLSRVWISPVIRRRIPRPLSKRIFCQRDNYTRLNKGDRQGVTDAMG